MVEIHSTKPVVTQEHWVHINVVGIITQQYSIYSIFYLFWHAVEFFDFGYILHMLLLMLRDTDTTLFLLQCLYIVVLVFALYCTVHLHFRTWACGCICLLCVNVVKLFFFFCFLFFFTFSGNVIKVENVAKEKNALLFSIWHNPNTQRERGKEIKWPFEQNKNIFYFKHYEVLAFKKKSHSAFKGIFVSCVRCD